MTTRSFTALQLDVSVHKCSMQLSCVIGRLHLTANDVSGQFIAEYHLHYNCLEDCLKL